MAWQCAEKVLFVFPFALVLSAYARAPQYRPCIHLFSSLGLRYIMRTRLLFRDNTLGNCGTGRQDGLAPVCTSSQWRAWRSSMSRCHAPRHCLSHLPGSARLEVFVSTRLHTHYIPMKTLQCASASFYLSLPFLIISSTVVFIFSPFKALSVSSILSSYFRRLGVRTATTFLYFRFFLYRCLSKWRHVLTVQA